jgi:2-polyprenyl-6-methoxyphenol hydroxylase-like FAD-dependent oxidoreductase
MRIAVLGAGPAGLLFAALRKQRHPQDEIVVFEQNPADATFGFGVVFSDRALDFLRDDDPDTHAALMPALEKWSDITVVHRNQNIVIDGIGFAAIERMALLRILQRRARDVGVVPRYGHTITELNELQGYDLIVGADGINSLVRRTFSDAFGASVTQLENKFAWFGTTAPFDSLTQTFVSTADGTFNAHHYRYAPGQSTFIVECDPTTWQRAGFANMDAATTATTCAEIFKDALGGAGLISNNSVWRNFPQLWCERWSHGRYVLVGDALHTAHFSIGSGTRLAFEDVIALANALDAEAGDVDAALAAYETKRKPIVAKIVRAANTSAAWYEHFAEHMALAPDDFALSYIMRTGRIEPERLSAMSPKFAARYAAKT